MYEHSVSVGEIWHEKENPQHEVKVTNITPYTIAYEYVSDGEKWSDAVETFKETFERGY